MGKEKEYDNIKNNKILKETPWKYVSNKKERKIEKRKENINKETGDKRMHSREKQRNLPVKHTHWQKPFGSDKSTLARK